MEKVLTISSIMIISIMINMVIQTTLFLTFFLSLRKRTGGFQADRFWKYYLLTVVSYVSILILYPYIKNYEEIMYGALAMSVIIIQMIGTVNHPNRDMNIEEVRESKKAARFLAAMEGICIVFSVLIGINHECIIFMALAVILCAILLCTAKILKQEVMESEQQ